MGGEREEGYEGGSSGAEVLSNAIADGRKDCKTPNSFWICSPYLSGEAFEWLQQHAVESHLYVITAVDRRLRKEFWNDPRIPEQKPRLRRWIEKFCLHTKRAAYLCVYDRMNMPVTPPRESGGTGIAHRHEEPLMHAKLYLDQWVQKDPDGDLRVVGKFEILSAFFGSMNFTRNGLGLAKAGQKPTPHIGPQNYELLATATDAAAASDLAHRFVLLWNRGGRWRYKFAPDVNSKWIWCDYNGASWIPSKW